MKVEKKELPPVLPPPCEYTITLTEQEATDLYNLLGCIGGLCIERQRTLDPLWALLSKQLGKSNTCFDTVVLSYSPKLPIESRPQAK